MAKVDVKIWNKTGSNASWNPDRQAVSIFPDKNKGMIYCTGHNWIEKNNDLKLSQLKECDIEIEEEEFGIVFKGTFKELCSKLKKLK